MSLIKDLILIFRDKLYPIKRINSFLDYSLTQEEIQKNKDIIKSGLILDEIKSVCWFLPEIKNINAGGISTIFIVANFLTEKYKCLNYLVFNKGSEENYYRMIKSLYPNLNFKIKIVGLDKNNIEKLPKADLGVCTFWSTAFHLVKYNDCKKKYYLLQDDERSFYSYNSMREYVETTYTFGFIGIANSTYIRDMYQKISGRKCYRYIPGVNNNFSCDEKIFQKEDALNIVVYARPSHERNCFEVIILAVKTIAEKLESKVIFHLVGENFNKKKYNLPSNCIVHGHISNENDLKEIYKKCKYGISFISTPTISYHQLDLIKSGICLITNRNKEIINVFTDDEVIYCDVNHNSLINLVINLVNKKSDYADFFTNNSNEKIKIFNWDLCLASIDEFMRKG